MLISSYVSGRTDGAVFHVLDGSRPMTTSAIQARFKKLAREGGNTRREEASALYAAGVRYADAVRYQDDWRYLHRVQVAGAFAGSCY